MTTLGRLAAATVAALLAAGCGAGTTTITAAPDGATPPATATPPTSASDAPAVDPGTADRSEVEAAAAAAVDDGTLCPGVEVTPGTDPLAGRTTVTDLDDGTAVAVVVCATYAHQSEVAIAAWDGTTLSPLPITVPAEGSDDPAATTRAATVAGAVTVEPSGRVHVVTRYRGLGDCGRAVDATLVDGALRTDEVREQPCDDGTGTPDATDLDDATWPVVST